MHEEHTGRLQERLLLALCRASEGFEDLTTHTYMTHLPTTTGSFLVFPS